MFFEQIRQLNISVINNENLCVSLAFMVLYGVVCLYTLFCLSSGLLKQEEKHMGRPKRLYLLGRYWSCVLKDEEADKATFVVSTQNRQIICGTTNVLVKVVGWYQNRNQGCGELVTVCHTSQMTCCSYLLMSRNNQKLLRIKYERVVVEWFFRFYFT